MKKKKKNLVSIIEMNYLKVQGSLRADIPPSYYFLAGLMMQMMQMKGWNTGDAR